eukprot:FR737084.1.p2 GENE.FR737084.1~~FR737084.1.p2  ORF type:complete len:105 (-),score=8.44 FR737084.1:269-583(-)
MISKRRSTSPTRPQQEAIKSHLSLWVSGKFQKNSPFTFVLLCDLPLGSRIPERAGAREPLIPEAPDDAGANDADTTLLCVFRFSLPSNALTTGGLRPLLVDAKV